MTRRFLDLEGPLLSPIPRTGLETCAAGNPCFVTRYDGEFVGNASLPEDAEGRFLWLFGRASAERVHPAGSQDQTGEACIHGFGEAAAGMSGEHYSADTLKTETHEPGRWSTLWGVFPIGPGIRRVHFEIRQADGHSATAPGRPPRRS